VASALARQIAEAESGLSAPVIHVGNLDARRDLTDVRDTVRAYATIASRGVPGRVYNVCSGRARRMRDLLDGLLDLSTVRVEIRLDADRLRPSDIPLLVGDPSRISSELGWRAEIPIEQTLADLLAHWRGRVAARRSQA
jgi:GDP-4-dehydro-6-deoxy-D-mannose reductase